MTTTHNVLDTLSSLSNSHTVADIAKQAFPDNAHIQDQAKCKKSILDFYAYLDLGNRKVLSHWLDSQVKKKVELDKVVPF